MDQLVYGVFSSREPAEAAQKTLHESAEGLEHDEEAASPAIHEYEIRPHDLPRSGNFARGSALAGGILVGSGVGVFLGLLMSGAFARIGGPETIIGSDAIDVMLVTLAAAVFGGILAGIAGTAGKRAQVRRLESEVAKGHVLLTLEAPKDRTSAIARTMTNYGALQTGAI
jgi:hypothetical protein